MALPKISVVTPSFNQAEFLEDTIQSVLGQNYPNLEYVIIDGGSTDGSAEIINRYANKLHYWESKEDNGHGDAINKGFSHTNGEIMAWINSDDKYTPWAFKVIAEIFSSFPHINWIVGYNSWWNDHGEMTSAKRVPKNVYDIILGNPMSIQQESVFWRRSLWEKAGGKIDTGFKLMVDGDLWSRFFLLDELYSVDCILGGYRIHSNNRAALHRDACNGEMERIITKLIYELPDEPRETLKTLRLVKAIQNTPLLRHIPISDLCRKLIATQAFEKACYKNIYYQDGSWNQRTLPFSVKSN